MTGSSADSEKTQGGSVCNCPMQHMISGKKDSCTGSYAEGQLLQPMVPMRMTGSSAEPDGRGKSFRFFGTCGRGKAVCRCLSVCTGKRNSLQEDRQRHIMESGKNDGRKKKHAGICCEKAQTGFGAACRRKTSQSKEKSCPGSGIPLPVWGMLPQEKPGS